MPARSGGSGRAATTRGPRGRWYEPSGQTMARQHCAATSSFTQNPPLRRGYPSGTLDGRRVETVSRRRALTIGIAEFVAEEGAAKPLDPLRFAPGLVSELAGALREHGFETVMVNE